MSRSDERPSKELYEQRNTMLFPIRQELVGKRFLLITEEAARRGGKNQRLENYTWKQGYIRASSVQDIHDKELQVLVEFDGFSWEYRQWIKIYEQTKAFFVEKTIVWAPRVYHTNNAHRSTTSWPALIFVPLVDYFGLDKESQHPVEFFGDKQLTFLKESEVGLFKDGDENLKQILCLNSRVQEELIGWQRLQKTQACLMNGAKTLTGARVTVYRLQLRQWYTGCITAHNLTTRELHVMDDNVLQTHPVHPALVQINLMANDDELHRILHGEQIKMLPTRRQRNPQIYFQANCPEQKPQGGITNWHMFRELSASEPKPGWTRPSVVRTISRGKPAFVPSVVQDLDSSPKTVVSQSLPTPSNNETNNVAPTEKPTGVPSTAKVKVHKPIAVVLKPSDSLPFPHYAGVPQQPKPSNSPLLSSLNSTPSPHRTQLTPSPLSGQHTPSPQASRNQTKQSPPQDSRSDASCNRSLSDHSLVHVVAEKDLSRAKNHDNHRPTHNPHSTSSSVLPSRKSTVIETPEKNKANSRLVSSPIVSSSSTRHLPSNKSVEGGNLTSFSPSIETSRKETSQATPRASATKTQSNENPIRDFSPGSECPPKVSAGVETHQQKSHGRSSANSSSTRKVSQPTVIIEDSPSPHPLKTLPPAQKHSTNNLSNSGFPPERGQSSRVENRSAQNVKSAQDVSRPSAENTQSSSTRSGSTQACGHLRSIANIQLEYLIFLKELFAFQHDMIQEAINALQETVTEEQFFFVADYCCKLVDVNRVTENIYREACITRQQKQREEHQRHRSQGNATCPSHIVDCLPESVKTRLRMAHEAASRQREGAFSVVLQSEELQKKGEQKEWELLKQQQLAKQQKQQEVSREVDSHLLHDEHRTLRVPQGQVESQKHNHAQQVEKEPSKEQQLSLSQQRENLDSSLSVDKLVEISKDIPMKQRQRKQKRAEQEKPDRPEHMNGVPAQLMQSPPQEMNSLSLQHKVSSEFLRTPQYLQQLRPLLPQSEQQNDELRQQEREMIDQLFQMTDMEQKTLQLQHIEQTLQKLQSQKVISRDVMKSAPTISSDFGNSTPGNELTKVQHKQSVNTVPREVNQSQAEQHLAKTMAPYLSAEQHVAKTMAPYLSAEQLLSSLTSTRAMSSTVLRFTENFGIAPGMISEKIPLAGLSQVLRTVEKDTTASTSISLDATSDGDMSAGSKKDKKGSPKSSMDKSSAKKRKTPRVTDPETPPKPKRQRKSAKKKGAGTPTAPEVAGPVIVPVDISSGCKSASKDRLAMKSAPPGEAMSLAIATSDRAVMPVKSNEEELSRSETPYQSRSITKGIGFVPTKAPAISGVSSFASIIDLVATRPSVTPSANHSLDVLASVSASLRTNNSSKNTQDVARPAVGNVIQSVVGGIRQFADQNRQRTDDCQTSIDDNRQLGNENRQHTIGQPTSADASRLSSDSIRRSADRSQAAEVGVPDENEVYSKERQLIEEFNQSLTKRSSEESRSENRLCTTASDANVDQVSALLNLGGKDQTYDQTATNLSETFKDKSIENKSVVLNGNVVKPKKARKEKQKRDKKSKITQKPGSEIPTEDGDTTKDAISVPVFDTVRDMSLLYLIAGDQNHYRNKSSLPVEHASSTHDDQKKMKPNSQQVNVSSLVQFKAVNGGDVEMPSKFSTPKPVESELNSTNIPKQSKEMKIQDSCTPMDSTCAEISHSGGPFPLDEGQRSLDDKSIETQRNEEKRRSKKTAKKETKKKQDGSKPKKSCEKKPKTPRGNKQGKEMVTKASKKSRKVEHNTSELLSKETVNDKMSCSGNDADETCAVTEIVEACETSLKVEDVSQNETSKESVDKLNLSLNECDRTKMSVTPSHNESSDVKPHSFQRTDANQIESTKSHDKTEDNRSSQRVECILEATLNISQDPLNIKLDSSKEAVSNKDAIVTIKNTTKIKPTGDVTELPIKHKSQARKTTGDKGNKTLATGEKGIKNNKKTGKKSERDEPKLNGMSAENITKTSGNTKPAEDKVTADENKQQSSLKELGNEQERKETDTSAPELVTADVVLNETGLESEIFGKDIVFVNEQSVENFVKAPLSKDDEDSVFEEGSLSRKRKRCSQNNDCVVSENSDIDSIVPAKNNETSNTESNHATNKKPASKKSTDNGEKKEAKVRKKKVKKENAEDEIKIDTKNESNISMETDTSAEIKTKAKKAKEAKEKKAREKVPKEDWVYFLQRGGCKALPSMPQCRECRNYETEEEAVINKSCCRFDMFRRCRSKSNKLEMAGFSSSENAQNDDFLPWIAGEDINKTLSLEVSKYILLNVGDEFCNLVKNEEQAFSLETKKETVAWKRAVRGIREMCDACATTIFNVHWVCPKCGFGVCLDCFKTRINMSVTAAESGRAKRFLWVRCSSNTSHRPQRLVLTHIIPKTTLYEIGEQLHAAREFWGIGEKCPCKRHQESLEDVARIQELHEEDKKHVADIFGEMPAVENNQDKVEATIFQEQNLEIPMDTECEQTTEIHSQEAVKTSSDDKTEKLDVENSCNSVATVRQSKHDMDIQPEVSECEVRSKQPELGEKIEYENVVGDLECQADKPLENQAEKVPEYKASIPPASQNKPPAREIDKPPETQVDETPKCEVNVLVKSDSCVEDDSIVNFVGNGIGALSLLMDYESPVSSPMASPVKEIDMEWTELSEITPTAESLLSRLNATIGESSAMISTTSETIDESALTSASSDTAGQSLVTAGACSDTAGQSLVTAGASSEATDGSSSVTGTVFGRLEGYSVTTGESSASPESHEMEDVSALFQSRITDELPAPHSWICRRPMLRLHSAHHEGNLQAFQSRWEKGEPVLVSDVHKHMTSHLWTPEGFENEFGSEKADVVNCKTGGTLEKLDIGTFWRGFESVKDRPLDNKREPTLLKLKDWPPEADFVEKMPTRFKDLMDALPLPAYTRRNGSRNLVARLPDFFVKPDLGPKMYNAYGNAAFPSAGTTNLHIDMSDAVNVMVYVGVPFDAEYGEQERKDSLACIDVACDEVQQHRARDKSEKLGALWHIFAAEDANTIRALFHKVASEKNMKYPASHDPIHDQCFYLDELLLKRLKEEYGVVGWPIAQFLGDAIFIPAGAPHQVRNLHSCVKAAEDFVSPEHVGHCFKLTEEFRHLSDKHTNHEDKLQVKNIIYHAVKDAVSVLRRRECELTSQTEETGNENI